jgi:hypothetical protein
METHDGRDQSFDFWGIRARWCAFYSNRYCMRPVIGAQLGENVRDVALNSRFSDIESVRNLFIGISYGNQSQDINFPGTQLILCRELGQLGSDAGRYSFAGEFGISTRQYKSSSASHLQRSGPACARLNTSSE